MAARLINITGRQFDRLYVIGHVRTEPNGALFAVRCACGVRKVVLGSSLRGKRTRSCGCIAREWQAARARAFNATAERDPVGRFTAST